MTITTTNLVDDNFKIFNKITGAEFEQKLVDVR